MSQLKCFADQHAVNGYNIRGALMGLPSFETKLRVLCMLAAAAMMSSNLALGADQIVWKLGHTLTVPGTLYEEILTKEVPARISKASGGQIQVQPIIGLINTNSVIGALQQGRVEMGDLTVAYSAATYPTWAVLNLPGLVNDQKLIAPIAKSIVMPVMTEDMKQWGIRPVMAFGWIGGSYFSNKRIATTKDFAGLSWRTHAPMLSQLITELGGKTIGMSFEELYPSLDRGIVDAYTTTYPAMHAAGLQKVTKYAIAAPNGTSLAVLMVSEEALGKLPADLRSKVLAEFEAIQGEIGDRLYNESLQVINELKAGGLTVITLPDAENQKLVAASKKAVWDVWLKQTGEKGEKLLKQVEGYK
jgi:TRAP-type transport system periplasmic protein